MKRREWRKVRAGEGLAEHPLAAQPIDAAARNTSPEMRALLRRMVMRPEGSTGATLRNWRATTKLVEALAKRGFIEVEWGKVPHRAGVEAKVVRAHLTERGRAVLAVFALGENGADTYAWAVPQDAAAVHVYAVGRGGGGGGGGTMPWTPPQHAAARASLGLGPAVTAAQVAAAINQTNPGVHASAVGANGISIGQAAVGPVQKPKHIRSAAEFRETFGRGKAVIVPPGLKVELVPGKKGV